MTMISATLAKPPVDTPRGGPLSAENRRQLTQAYGKAKTIRKAARVAAFNGWTTATIALLSAPFAVMSRTGFLVFIGLSVVAVNELRGRKQLLRFDPRAATLLGWNQLGLLAMVVIYCLWTIYTSLNGANSVTADLHAYTELEAALGPMGEIEALARQIVVALYGAVIALSVVFQGLNALYYFTRRKYVDAYVATTPAWIRDLPSMTSPA